MMRLAGRSVSGLAAASRARSIPYLAISSAALAVNASASAGVAPSASALASSLRTRSSSAPGVSAVIGSSSARPRAGYADDLGDDAKIHFRPPVIGIEYSIETLPGPADVFRDRAVL